MPISTTLVIQAGGRSSRMGRDKALVELGGRPLIQHVLDRTHGLTDHTLITTNNPDSLAHLNIPMVSDETPGAGALHGFKTALSAVTTSHLIVVAVDMPFLERGVLNAMLLQIGEDDAVIPVWGGRKQPFCAVYRRDTVKKAVEEALAAGQQRMNSFHAQLSIHELAQKQIEAFALHEHLFFNVNTPDDLAQAEAILAGLQSASSSLSD